MMKKPNIFQIKKAVASQDYYLFRKGYLRYFEGKLKDIKISKTSHVWIYKLTATLKVAGKIEAYFAIDRIFDNIDDAKKHIETFTVTEAIERLGNL